MKIQIMSDIHLEFADCKPVNTDADIVVIAGDLHAGKQTLKSGINWMLENFHDTPVLYVLGNHEFYSNSYPNIITKIREKLTGTNVFLLENENFEYNGVTFHGATLWTDYKLKNDIPLSGLIATLGMNDYNSIRIAPGYSKIRYYDILRIHKKSLLFLKNSLQSSGTDKNVVITHHCPSERSIPNIDEFSGVRPAYASDLENFIIENKPGLWIHGHVHQSCDYMIGDTRIVSNPRGYPPPYCDQNFENYNSGFIVEV